MFFTNFFLYDGHSINVSELLAESLHEKYPLLFSDLNWINEFSKHTSSYLHTYLMQQSPSWEADRFSTSQRISRILWDSKVHYLGYNSQLPVPFLSQINPVHVLYPKYWRSILILSCLLLCPVVQELSPDAYRRFLQCSCRMSQKPI